MKKANDSLENKVKKEVPFCGITNKRVHLLGTSVNFEETLDCLEVALDATCKGAIKGAELGYCATKVAYEGSKKAYDAGKKVYDWLKSKK